MQIRLQQGTGHHFPIFLVGLVKEQPVAWILRQDILKPMFFHGMFNR